MLLFSLWQLPNLEFTVVERLGKLNNLILDTIPCFFLLGIFSHRVTTGGALIGGIASTIFAILFNGIPGFLGQVVEGMN